jgi:hypothetical protein
VGWYSTGPKLRESDLDINELMRQFCDNPVLVICEVQVRTVSRALTCDGQCPSSMCPSREFLASSHVMSGPCSYVPALAMQPKEVGLPFTAYYSVNEVRADGTEKAKKASLRHSPALPSQRDSRAAAMTRASDKDVAGRAARVTSALFPPAGVQQPAVGGRADRG